MEELEEDYEDHATQESPLLVAPSEDNSLSPVVSQEETGFESTALLVKGVFVLSVKKK